MVQQDLVLEVRAARMGLALAAREEAADHLKTVLVDPEDEARTDLDDRVGMVPADRDDVDPGDLTDHQGAGREILEVRDGLTRPNPPPPSRRSTSSRTWSEIIRMFPSIDTCSPAAFAMRRRRPANAALTKVRQASYQNLAPTARRSNCSASSSRIFPKCRTIDMI